MIKGSGEPAAVVGSKKMYQAARDEVRTWVNRTAGIPKSSSLLDAVKVLTTKGRFRSAVELVFGVNMNQVSQTSLKLNDRVFLHALSRGTAAPGLLIEIACPGSHYWSDRLSNSEQDCSIEVSQKNF